MEGGMTFAVWEQAVLLLLVAGSTGLFIQGLLSKIRHIRAGKPDEVSIPVRLRLAALDGNLPSRER